MAAMKKWGIPVESRHNAERKPDHQTSRSMSTARQDETWLFPALAADDVYRRSVQKGSQPAVIHAKWEFFVGGDDNSHAIDRNMPITFVVVATLVAFFCLLVLDVLVWLSPTVDYGQQRSFRVLFVPLHKKSSKGGGVVVVVGLNAMGGEKAMDLSLCHCCCGSLFLFYRMKYEYR